MTGFTVDDGGAGAGRGGRGSRQYQNVGDFGRHQARTDGRLPGWVLGSVVMGIASFGQQDDDGPRRHHRAAAAHRYDKVRFSLARHAEPVQHRRHGRAGSSPVKYSCRRFSQRLRDPIQQIGALGYRLATDHKGPRRAGPLHGGSQVG